MSLMHIAHSAVLALSATLLPAAHAIAQTPPTTTDAAKPHTYGFVFPLEIPGLGFTMPKQAFLDVLAGQNLASTANSANTIFLVQPPGAPYTSAVFYFNSNAGEILNEMELRFASGEHAKAYFDARFPPNLRNRDNEYVNNDGVSGHAVKAWMFGTKVFIVATLPNTRWANQR